MRSPSAGMPIDEGERRTLDTLPADIQGEILARLPDPRSYVCASRALGRLDGDPLAATQWAIAMDRPAFAAKHGLLEAVAALLGRGSVDPAAKREMLLEASENGHPQVVRLLLAESSTIDDHGGALEAACRNGRVEAALVLLNEGSVDQEHVDRAAAVAFVHGRVDVVRLLLDRGVDIAAQLFCCPGLLCGACELGHVAMVRMLLQRGCDANECEGGPLASASAKGDLPLVGLLLDWGARVDANNESALRRAAQNGHVGVVRLLMDVRARAPAAAAVVLPRKRRWSTARFSP